jgi:type IV pilus assembly protein PilC
MRDVIVSQFVATVKDPQGKKRTVEREASDHQQLVDLLHREGLFVIEVKEADNGRPREVLRSSPKRSKKSSLFSFLHRSKGVKLDRLVFFTRQLSTMINAGIPIVRVIRSLAGEEKQTFGRILFQVADDVEQGETLSGAMRNYPEIFSRLYTALVESGEESGKLDVIMDQLADYLESVADMRMRVKSALRYPIFIFSFIALILLAFILFVIPKFAQIYDSFGAKLPAPTQVVLTFSGLVRDNILVVFLATVALVGLIRLIVRTESGALMFDRIKLQIPAIGSIIRRTVVSRLARTLSVLVHSGMPIVQALNIVRRAADNRVYENGILETKRRVEEGQNLAEALHGTKVFPELMLQMVSTGEQSGTLDLMFDKVAQFYDKQVKTAVDGLVSLIEPMAIIFMGVTVGGIILIMYLPIFRLGMVMR